MLWLLIMRVKIKSQIKVLIYNKNFIYLKFTLKLPTLQCLSLLMWNKTNDLNKDKKQAPWIATDLLDGFKLYYFTKYILISEIYLRITINTKTVYEVKKKKNCLKLYSCRRKGTKSIFKWNTHFKANSLLYQSWRSITLGFVKRHWNCQRIFLWALEQQKDRLHLLCDIFTATHQNYKCKSCLVS